jgi:RsiW-degrading membrane proteinase PrsW (M82 family)
VLTGGLTGLILLVARISSNSTMLPPAALIGAMAGPLAFLVWLDDRARVGRSVEPDVLLLVWLIGGGVAVLIAGISEHDIVHHQVGASLWVAATEETAKVVVPLVVCGLVPRYRTVERALALALVSSAGFAVLESLTYASFAYRESIKAVRDVLIERTVATPFVHLPWTAIAVIVAARVWHRHQRITLSPAALWGFALAIVLHATWNGAIATGGWWHLLVIPTAVVTFAVMYRLVSGVHYDGPYAIPADHAPRRLSRHHR